ncbi:MAG: aminopeptidase P family protein [Planctomycetes bacterium]|nr:aminopeptidase P family protein [Planctomycetota bacterium]
MSKGEILDRVAAVRDQARQRGWHGLVAVGRSFYDLPGNVVYLSGHFPPFPASPARAGRRGLGHAVVVVPIEHDPVLLVDGEYREELVAISDVRPCRDLVAGLAGLLRELGHDHSRLGLAGEQILPVAYYRDLLSLCPHLSFDSADPLLAQMRSRKSPAEQALLRRAAEIAGTGLKAAVDTAKPGATESQVCAAGTAAAIEAGADFVRYLRVHSGPWSVRGSRWPPATDRVIQPGDTVYLDIIGACRGYQFDVLRTTVAGSPSPWQVEVFEAVHAALEEAVAAARPGVLAHEIFGRAREVLTAAGLGPHVTPFAGHGIGLETVEAPYLVAEDSWPLEQSMVLCIEPKVSLPGEFGCSIEQEVIVRPDGPEVITHFPTRLWAR